LENIVRKLQGGDFLTHTVVCSSVMHFGTHTFSVVCPNTTAGAHTSMENSYLVQDGTKDTSPIRWLVQIVQPHHALVMTIMLWHKC